MTPITVLEQLAPPMPLNVGLFLEAATAAQQASYTKIIQTRDRLAPLVDEAARINVGPLRHRLMPEGLALASRARELALALRESFDRAVAPALRDALRALAAPPAAEWEVEALVKEIKNANATYAGFAECVVRIGRDFNNVVAKLAETALWSEAYQVHETKVGGGLSGVPSA